MPDTIHFLTFLLSGVLVNIYPGPDTLYIIARTVAQGPKAGLFSVLGISSGAVVHTLAVALGLSSILAASPRAFFFVKCVGSLYLVYLGAGLLIKAGKEENRPGGAATDREGRIYLQGVITNITNPKVALFFLSFLPQFVNPVSGHTVVTLLFLGSVFITTGTLWCLFIVFLSSRVSGKLQGVLHRASLLGRAGGVVLILLGIYLFAGTI